MNSKTDHVLMSLPSSGAGSVLVTEETLKKWLKASAESLMACQASFKLTPENVV